MWLRQTASTPGVTLLPPVHVCTGSVVEAFLSHSPTGSLSAPAPAMLHALAARPSLVRSEIPSLWDRTAPTAPWALASCPGAVVPLRGRRARPGVLALPVEVPALLLPQALSRRSLRVPCGSRELRTDPAQQEMRSVLCPMDGTAWPRLYHEELLAKSRPCGL